jgi:hypothetical protein
MLGASIRYGASSFEIGDCSEAPIWVRNLQFTAVTVEVPFTYQEPNGATKDVTVIIPGGSPAGTTVQATLDAEFPNAVKILESIYAGILRFDIFMGWRSDCSPASRPALRRSWLPTRSVRPWSMQT